MDIFIGQVNDNDIEYLTYMSEPVFQMYWVSIKTLQKTYMELQRFVLDHIVLAYRSEVLCVRSALWP